MIRNSELYSLEPKKDSTELPPESHSSEDSNFKFLSTLLYQTIIATCSLIILLTLSRGNLPWFNWIKDRMHSAINASQADTFGRIGDSKLWHTIITNTGNLVRLEEITKKIADPGFEIKNQVSQVFLDSVWPVQGSITKGYGWRYDPIEKIKEFHTGIEISAAPDAIVLAVADGTITEIKHQPGTGWQIIISHADGWSSSYSYLGLVNVKVSQRVKAGDAIAQINRPDQDKGSILLLEIKEYDKSVDPLSLLAS
jgi:murein DD-endopeptidase MepM/ murein hydrolase activator NlpD